MGPPTGRTRSQTVTIDESSANNNVPEQQLLPDDTPSWGKSLYNLLNDSIQALDAKLTNFQTTFQTTIQTVTETADAAYTLAQSNKTNVDSLSDKIDVLASKVDNYLSDAVEFLLSENRKRDDHILRNESYSRRENLVFRGYNVAKDDPESSADKVRNILRVMGIPNVQHIQFQRCHYLNDKKLIIARFQHYTDRERVWLNRYKLKIPHSTLQKISPVPLSVNDVTYTLSTKQQRTYLCTNEKSLCVARNWCLTAGTSHARMPPWQACSA